MTKLIYTISSLAAASLLHFAFSTPATNLRKSQHQQDLPLLVSEPDTLQEYTADATRDLVSNLPGLNFEPTFKQFSGYIAVSPTRNIHYWYIESSNNPSTDPVVFWTNGGPGCSGLLGLGTEFGPFLFEKDGVLSQNPNTWNQVANILYVEQPAGVGFSYFTDDSDRNVGDDRAAVDNYQLIKQFFKRFPERKTNPFYIASESFGGHYIPHLAKEILDQNTDNSINFRGFMIGNPYVDPFSNDATMIQTYYMHGLIALPLFQQWEIHCTDPTNYPEEKCTIVIDTMLKDAGNGINPYALDFPTCTEPDNNYPPAGEEAGAVLEVSGYVSATSRRRTLATSSAQSIKLMKHSSAMNPPFLPQEDVYHPCAETHLYNYLNRDDVKDALHVQKTKDWSMCTDDIEYSTDDSDTPQMYLYEELIERARVEGSNLKMMIFSGDDDSSEYRKLCIDHCGVFLVGEKEGSECNRKVITPRLYRLSDVGAQRCHSSIFRY